MIQPRRQPDLANETLARMRLGNLRSQHLECDFAIVLEIVRQKHRCHSARAEFALDVISVVERLLKPASQILAQTGFSACKVNIGGPRDRSLRAGVYETNCSSILAAATDRRLALTNLPQWQVATASVIIHGVIRSFADAATEDLFNSVDSRRARQRCPSTLWAVVARKFTQLNRVRELRELAVPPGNRLEALKGARRNQHSIRINDQFRICFRWEEGYADDVEVTDSH